MKTLKDYPELEEYLEPLTLLGTHDWARDSGFRRYLNKHYNKMGEYYFTEATDKKTLYDLFNYFDAEGARCTLAYFELPPQADRFCGWVWNNIALDPKTKLGNKRPCQVFRFDELYAIYRYTHGRHTKWIQYKDRITNDKGQYFPLEVSYVDLHKEAIRAKEVPANEKHIKTVL